MSTNRRNVRAVLAALGVMVLVALVAAVPAGATTGTMYVNASTTLTEDHQGNIFIAADNVTLDCAGHSVISAASQRGTGVGIAALGRANVTIRNCRVSGFAHGISLAGSNFTVTGNISSGNSKIGITVAGEHGTVAGNSARDNDWNGIAVGGGGQSRDIQVTTNTASGNGQHGFSDGGFVVFSPYPFVHYPTGISFVDNLSIGNNGAGFWVSAMADGVFFAGNSASDNWGIGFSIDRSDGHTFDHNTGVRNAADFVANFSSDTVYTHNTAADSEAGFVLYQGSGGTYDHNVAMRHSSEGFLVMYSSGVTLTNNVSNNNLSGFVLYYFANSNTLTRNVANSNDTWGFRITNDSTGNTISRSIAHANGSFDATDEAPPGSNTWTNNNFGTTSPTGLH